MDINIYKGSQVIKELTNQQSDAEAYGYLLKEFSHSVDHALKHEGYIVELVTNNEVSYYLHYKQEKFQKSFFINGQHITYINKDRIWRASGEGYETTKHLTLKDAVEHVKGIKEAIK